MGRVYQVLSSLWTLVLLLLLFTACSVLLCAFCVLVCSFVLACLSGHHHHLSIHDFCVTASFQHHLFFFMYSHTLTTAIATPGACRGCAKSAAAAQQVDSASVSAGAGRRRCWPVRYMMKLYRELHRQRPNDIYTFCYSGVITVVSLST